MTLHDSLETFRESAEASLSLTVAYLPKLLGAVLLVLVDIYSRGTSVSARPGC